MNDKPNVPSSACDVVVVGAGAAGVAAGRRLMEAGLDIVVVEARDRLGGRAHTVAPVPDMPVDVGCEWLHSAERNPWVGVARALGFAIDETLPNWGARVSWHFGEAAQDDWMAAREAFDERCEAAAREEHDRAESELLEPGGKWNALIGAISTWANGTELERVSVKDHARYENSMLNWRVLKGYGALISAAGATLPVRLGTMVERIDHRGKTITIATSRGDISARAVIVTIPTNLLARETIRFLPALPDKIAAAAGLPLGIADKMYFAIEGPAEDLPRDRHLVGKIDRVATGGYHVRIHGWPVIEAYFGGTLATELEQARARRAWPISPSASWSGLLGSAHQAAAQAHRPFGLGARSARQRLLFLRAPRPCRRPPDLVEPVDERIFFAGEACSVNFFGTAHAAYISAVAAAERAIASLGRAAPTMALSRR